MKKVYNWTLGGFFRALGRYFAYFLIFCLLALLSRKIGLPLFADIVFAETNQTYTSATYEVRQCKQRLNNGNYELYDCVSDNANFNESIQFGSENGHLKRIQYLLYNSNNYWNTGSYNIRLKIAIGYDFSFSELQEYRFVMYANENDTSNGAQGGANSKYIANYTCNVENDTESTYDFYVNCMFNTKAPIKFFMIEMIKDYEAPGTINTDWIWWMQVSSFTASTDSTDAINNQTDILNDAINNTNNTINNAIDKQIESQKVCTMEQFDKSKIKEDNKYLNQDGTFGGGINYGVSDYIEIKNTTDIEVKKVGYNSYCFYNSNKQYISCGYPNTLGKITPPNNANYIRITFNKSDNIPIMEIETCKNGNQALNDTLTDSSSPDLSSLSNSAGWLPAGPVDSILNLPLTYLNTLSTALNGTCQEVQPTLPYINQQITLPCIKSLYIQMNVMSFVNWVGALVSGFILFKYFMNLYKWVDDTLTFRENNYIDNWGGVD